MWATTSGAHAGEKFGVLLLDGGEGEWGVGSEIGGWSGSGLGRTMVFGIFGDDLGGECLRWVEHGVGEFTVGVGEAIVQEVEVVWAGAWLGTEIIYRLEHAGVGRAEGVEVLHGELKTVEDFAGDILIDAPLD